MGSQATSSGAEGSSHDTSSGSDGSSQNTSSGSSDIGDTQRLEEDSSGESSPVSESTLVGGEVESSPDSQGVSSSGESIDTEQQEETDLLVASTDAGYQNVSVDDEQEKEYEFEEEIAAESDDGEVIQLET